MNSNDGIKAIVENSIIKNGLPLLFKIDHQLNNIKRQPCKTMIIVNVKMDTIK